jgi:hypothetical protein
MMSEIFVLKSEMVFLMWFKWILKAIVNEKRGFKHPLSTEKLGIRV